MNKFFVGILIGLAIVIVPFALHDAYVRVNESFNRWLRQSVSRIACEQSFGSGEEIPFIKYQYTRPTRQGSETTVIIGTTTMWHGVWSDSQCEHEGQ